MEVYREVIIALLGQNRPYDAHFSFLSAISEFNNIPQDERESDHLVHEGLFYCYYIEEFQRVAKAPPQQTIDLFKAILERLQEIYLADLDAPPIVPRVLIAGYTKLAYHALVISNSADIHIALLTANPLYIKAVELYCEAFSLTADPQFHAHVLAQLIVLNTHIARNEQALAMYAGSALLREIEPKLDERKPSGTDLQDTTATEVSSAVGVAK